MPSHSKDSAQKSFKRSDIENYFPRSSPAARYTHSFYYLPNRITRSDQLQYYYRHSPPISNTESCEVLRRGKQHFLRAPRVASCRCSAGTGKEDTQFRKQLTAPKGSSLSRDKCEVIRSDNIVSLHQKVRSILADESLLQQIVRLFFFVFYVLY